MSSGSGPTLTGPEAMGGIRAQDGFDYQEWDALLRLPSWLRNPAFEGFCLESLEDCEARFFAPQSPNCHVIDRFQAKSGALDAGDLKKVFSAFRNFAEANPATARSHVLVTPGLPPKLAWIAHDTMRVRRARPFYAPFTTVLAASNDQLVHDLGGAFGQELGAFIAGEVDIEVRPQLDRRTTEAFFAAEFVRCFAGEGQRVLTLSSVFAALLDLVSRSRGTFLTRRVLLDCISVAGASELVPQSQHLPIHIRSDRSGESHNAVDIDASAFSAVGAKLPGAIEWRSSIVEPLLRTAAWASKQSYRRIALTGMYRLSTAFAVGACFRSASGFEIDIPTKDGQWPTDAHPPPTAVGLPWVVTQPQGLHGDRLLVAIGVLRNPAPQMLASRGLAEREDELLVARLDRALTSASEVQSCVRALKSAVSEAVERLRPARIDLCYAGPAAFAVALGHRWNGLPPTQLYEFDTAEGRYCSSVLLD